MFELTSLNRAWANKQPGLGREDSSLSTELLQLGVGTGPKPRALALYEPTDAATDAAGTVVVLLNLPRFLHILALQLSRSVNQSLSAGFSFRSFPSSISVSLWFLLRVLSLLSPSPSPSIHAIRAPITAPRGRVGPWELEAAEPPHSLALALGVTTNPHTGVPETFGGDADPTDGLEQSALAQWLSQVHFSHCVDTLSLRLVFAEPCACVAKIMYDIFSASTSSKCFLSLESAW